MAQTEHIKEPQAEERVERERMVVVGGGPAGLAVAAVLMSKHIDALVLDRANSLGASWKAHYRLLLHTVRWLSHLPGLRMPRGDGKWVARDSVVRYLKRYADHHALRVRLDTPVTSIRREGSAWRVETNDRLVSADAVVMQRGTTGNRLYPIGLDTRTR